MLNITYDIANRYHIEFGAAKSKILKIGKTKTKPDLYLGSMKMEYENTYKYLGETLNTKGNLENHLNEIKKKSEAAYQTILTIMGNQQFSHIELETAWKLLETCIQPILTYGGETWKLNKKEEIKINQIQANIIKRILMVPLSTPTETIYIETGLLDITTIVKKNRINMTKRLQKHPEKITTKVMEANTPGGWKENTDRIQKEINPKYPNTATKRQDIPLYFKEKNTKASRRKDKKPISNQKYRVGCQKETNIHVRTNMSRCSNDIQNTHKNAGYKTQLQG